MKGRPRQKGTPARRWERWNPAQSAAAAIHQRDENVHKRNEREESASLIHLIQVSWRRRVGDAAATQKPKHCSKISLPTSTVARHLLHFQKGLLIFFIIVMIISISSQAPHHSTHTYAPRFGTSPDSLKSEKLICSVLLWNITTQHDIFYMKRYIKCNTISKANIKGRKSRLFKSIWKLKYG